MTTTTARRGARERAARDAYGMAAASFILGLVGLLVFNVFLGPAAVILAALALHRGTSHRNRAYLGMALGVADVIVFLVLTGAQHNVTWSF
ncbi:DUF4190 domain-containing protein [Streptomyces sp. PTM05]|uniref:DUF4190 domain-containing protein n=1 Tax=Streptantibioticus parmotrematis TaxID=2873249 RepID=A0ABS7QSG9_9ACTN|nr:DUF4190 domain-containing protein [Streptantibioticus parmotrematis]MBY8885330.1 DUF4190 domain-containing protein [Streptantibioticus parmotrematis]